VPLVAVAGAAGLGKVDAGHVDGGGALGFEGVAGHGCATSSTSAMRMPWGTLQAGVTL